MTEIRKLIRNSMENFLTEKSIKSLKIFADCCKLIDFIGKIKRKPSVFMFMIK